MITYFVLLLVSCTLASGRQGFGPGDQDWGYVEVRPHAHMFWWLHHTTAVTTPTDRPLVIWIQGGPGASSSGEGNIFMSGLVDENQEPRDFSYVHLANVLYVDNPVGAGYSYVDVDKGGEFAANITVLQNDYIQLLKGFFQEHPEFEDVPLYLIGESFGGKFAPAYARKIFEEVRGGNLKANLKGVGMAYPAADILTNIETMPGILFAANIVDAEGYNVVWYKMKDIKDTAHRGDWVEAGNKLDELLDYVMSTYNLDFISVISNKMDAGDFTELNNFMDTEVSPILNITTKFGRQREVVSQAMLDKLRPTVEAVRFLLDTTDVKVAVYNGQLDWVVNSLGTYTWVRDLKWNGGTEWAMAARHAFYWDGIHEGHVKEYGHLSLYWVKRAGHRLPNDNPNAMKYILKQLIGY